MKYIRTKDGRIIKHPHPNAEVFTFRYEILKTADTIEELCDEFVIKVDNDYLHAKYYPVDRTFYIYNTDEEISLGECLRFNYIVYGAIWIKGEHGEPILKSVAKMKGVLPNGEIDWELL